MRLIYLVVLFVVYHAVSVSAQNVANADPQLDEQQPEHLSQRDAQAIDILTRVVVAAGGPQRIAAVNDITEYGDILFNWGEGAKGSVTIKAKSGDRFRMETGFATGKSTWIVKEGEGLKKDEANVTLLSADNAINLENLTYPIAYVLAALADHANQVSFVRIEKRGERQVYRLRLKGPLGLTGGKTPVVKDLIIDALAFDILSVDDHPFKTSSLSRTRGVKLTEDPTREIDFEDFRTIDGVRVPFSVRTQLLGQQTLSIHLSEIKFNSNLSDDEFRLQK